MSHLPTSGCRDVSYDYYDEQTGRYFRVDLASNRIIYEDGEVVPRTVWLQHRDEARHDHHRTASHSREGGYAVSGGFAESMRSGQTAPSTDPPRPQYTRAQPSTGSHVGLHPPATVSYAPSIISDAPVPQTPIGQGQQPTLSYPIGQPSASNYQIPSSASGYPASSVLSPRVPAAALSRGTDQDALANQLRNASLNEQRPPQAPWSDQERTPHPAPARPAQPDETRRSHPAVRMHTSSHNGVNTVHALNSQNGVQTIMGTHPPNLITEPALFQHQVSAYRMLYPTQGSAEPLFPNFQVRPKSFFVRGRVFMTLWSEPAGSTSLVTSVVAGQAPAPSSQSGITPGLHGQQVFSKVRRFVVIREGSNFCTALPINSYGSQGVGKKDVKKSDHCIIFTSNLPPRPLDAEWPRRGESPMRHKSIRVVPDAPKYQLSDASRLDYGKPHTIHHNLKVSPSGMVHRESMAELFTQFHNVWGVRPDVSAAVAGSSRLPQQQQQQQQRAAGEGREDRRQPRPTASGSRAGVSQQPQQEYSRTGRQSAPQPSDALGQQRQEAAALRQAYEARHYFQGLIGRGYAREQAFALMAQRLMESENCSRERAAALLNYRLQYGQAGSRVGRGVSEEGENEDDEDDDEEDEEEEANEDKDLRRGHDRR